MPNNDNYEYMRFLDLTGVQQIWDTAKQTFVQTVNGQGIDANGNVNVSGGSDANALYQLGKYDTYVDNNDGSITITRQTGYAILTELDILSVNASSPVSASLLVDFGVYSKVIPSSNSETITFTTNQGLEPKTANNLYNYNVSGISTQQDGKFTMRVKDVADLATFKTYLPVCIEYQLTTSYTEKVIKNVAYKKQLTLLWKNANPNTSFGGATLQNLPDLTQFESFILEYKASEESTNPSLYQEFKLNGFASNNASFAVSYISQNSSVQYLCSRSYTFLSSTSILIDNGYSNKSAAHSVLIPVKIYGVKS